MAFSNKVKQFFKQNPVTYRLMMPVLRSVRTFSMARARMKQGMDGDKVVFSSFGGKNYNDNPRYISEKLHEMDPKAKIVWLFDETGMKNAKTPDYVIRAAALSKEGLAHRATARVWVDNWNMSPTIAPAKGIQFYINTWHGDRGFKKVGRDNEKSDLTDVRMESRCSLMVAGSRFGAGTYRTAFDYKGEVMMDGCPRNDLLLNPDSARSARYRREMGLAENTRFLIYAPPYRDQDRQALKARIDIPRCLEILEEVTGEKWACLCRAHYLGHGIDAGALNGKIIDMTAWPEMAHILSIGDMIISDYSSCAADFLLTRKPAILYQNDIADYMQDSRSLYFKMEDSPFLIAHNMDELEKILRANNAETYRKNGEDVDAFFGTTETGHAAEAVCRYIMEKLGHTGK